MHRFWCLLVLLLFFVSPLPHWQNVSHWGLFFIWGNKKSYVERDGENRAGGTHGSCHFLSKTAKHTEQGALISHLSWNGPRSWVFKKNSLEPNSASHNTTSWYTDTDGFLEHSPSRGSLSYKGPALQKIIPVFWGVPPWMYKVGIEMLVLFPRNE